MEKIDEFLNKNFSGRKFKGNYKERTYVRGFDAYREVIEVSECETELISELKTLVPMLEINKITPMITLEHTDSTVAVNLLVSFSPSSQNYEFGVFTWEFTCVQVVRSTLILALTRSKDDLGTASLSDNTNNNNFDLTALWTSLKAVTFTVCLLSAMLIEGSVKILTLLTSITLKILDIMPQLIRSVTPFLLALVDCFNKIVGGFYILILGLCRPPAQGVEPMHRAMVGYQSEPSRNISYYQSFDKPERNWGDNRADNVNRRRRY